VIAMRGLLMDFDGVIADSEALHDEALRAVCEPLGFRWGGEPFVGWPDAEVFVHLHRDSGRDLSAEGLADLLARKTEVVLEQVRSGLYRAYPGAVELIRDAARSVPVAVCSAGLRDQIVPVLEMFGVSSVVRAVVSAEDTPRTKPAPDPYLLGADRIGIAAADCVAVEDSERGVAAAKAAGCITIGVGHTSARERLRAADWFVDRLEGIGWSDLLALGRAPRGAAHT